MMHETYLTMYRPHFFTSMARTMQSARKSKDELDNEIYESEFGKVAEYFSEEHSSDSDRDSDYGNCA